MEYWTDDWPTEVGWYWFYGTRFGERESELCLVEACQASNALMYITHGHFLYKGKSCVGKWQKAVLPTLPELNNIEGGKNDRG